MEHFWRRGGRTGARVPRRPRMVGRQPLPAGPAPPAGPRGRAGPPCGALEPHPAERLAGDVQRPRVRLAAPRRALPPRSRNPPVHAGHLDLLPLVRRVFRHRMPDARLATVESVLLGIRRHADVAGWEIPARYLEFLRFGEPAAAGGSGSPQRRGRALAGAAARPRGSRLRRRGALARGAGRRPCRAGTGLRERGPARGGARLPRVGDRRLALPAGHSAAASVSVSSRAPPRAPKGPPRWRSVTSGRPSRFARIQTTTVRGGRHATARISVATRAAMPCPTPGRPRIPSGVMRHGPRAGCSGSEPGCCGGSAGAERPRPPGPSSSRPAARSRRSPGSRSPSCGSTSTGIHRAPSPPRCWPRPSSSGRPGSVGGCHAWNRRWPGGSRACGHACFGLRRSRRASNGGACGEAPRRARERQTGPGPRSPATPRQPRAGCRSHGRETRRPVTHRA